MSKCASVKSRIGSGGNEGKNGDVRGGYEQCCGEGLNVHVAKFHKRVTGMHDG
jgi:phage-related protein